MSGGSKQKYKQFNINNFEDACLVMVSLISRMIVNLDKYKEYALEVDKLLEESDSEYIEAKAYEDIKDKLLYRQQEILKLIADKQKSSFSYLYIREWLKDHDYLKSSLSKNIADILNEMLDIRNWSFHNPQSLMVAAKEVAEKRMSDELKEIAQVKPQLNPVLIRKTSKYENIILCSLSIHVSTRINQFEKVLESMKNDYQELYDSIDNKPFIFSSKGLSNKVQYIEIDGTGVLFDYHSDIAQISMAIQKSKYDGSEEKFNKWVIRPKAKEK